MAVHLLLIGLVAHVLGLGQVGVLVVGLGSEEVVLGVHGLINRHK